MRLWLVRKMRKTTNPSERRPPLIDVWKIASSLKKGLAGLPKAVWARVSSPSLREKLDDGILPLVLMSLLLVGNVFLEQTSPFQFLKNVGYEILQLRLSSQREDSKVMVVDITGMHMDRHPTNRDLDYTNRKELEELIKKIAVQQPRAIAIDLDFEPEASRRKKDCEFLSYCLDLQQGGVPIFVGVHTAVAFGPDMVLGDSRFASLAAFVGFPRGKRDDLRRWAVEFVVIPSDNHPAPWICPSLSAAATQLDVKPSFPWPGWLLKHESDFPGEKKGFGGKKFLIDYGLLERFETKSITISSELKNTDLEFIDAALSRKAFCQKYVFLGRGILSEQTTGDKFLIPGRKNSPHAGVYVHACAAQTLLRGALYELSDGARVLADAVLCLLVIGFVVVYSHWKGQPDRAQEHRLEKSSFLVAAAVVVGVGYGAVRWTRLMWDDFFLVAIVLGAHPWMEEKLKRAGIWAVSLVYQKKVGGLVP